MERSKIHSKKQVIKKHCRKNSKNDIYGCAQFRTIIRHIFQGTPVKKQDELRQTAPKNCIKENSYCKKTFLLLYRFAPGHVK